MLQRSMSELEKALPKGRAAEQFVRVLMTTVQKTPLLASCSQRSIMVAAFEAASLGLCIDGVLGHAYVIPYKVKGVYQAQLQIGYRGFVEMAHRAGVALQGSAVREHDQYDYAEGTEGFVTHRKKLDGDRGELLFAYAHYRPYEHPELRGVVVLPRGDVFKRRDVSRSAGRDDSPWAQWPDEMWSKTAVRALAKQVPQSSDLQRLAVADEQRELGIGNAAIVDADIPELSEVDHGAQ